MDLQHSDGATRHRCASPDWYKIVLSTNMEILMSKLRPQIIEKANRIPVSGEGLEAVVDFFLQN